MLTQEMQKLDGVMQEFDSKSFGIFVDHMTVYEKEKIGVTFKDGTEIIV